MLRIGQMANTPKPAASPPRISQNCERELHWPNGRCSPLSIEAMRRIGQMTNTPRTAASPRRISHICARKWARRPMLTTLHRGDAAYWPNDQYPQTRCIAAPYFAKLRTRIGEMGDAHHSPSRRCWVLAKWPILCRPFRIPRGPPRGPSRGPPRAQTKTQIKIQEGPGLIPSCTGN